MMFEPKVVIPPDELDPVTAPVLDDLLRACDPEGETVVEFEQVRFCDSSGIRVLINHSLRHVEAGGYFRITGVSPMIRHVFDITGVSRLFGLEDEGQPTAGGAPPA